MKVLGRNHNIVRNAPVGEHLPVAVHDPAPPSFKGNDPDTIVRA